MEALSPYSYPDYYPQHVHPKSVLALPKEVEKTNSLPPSSSYFLGFTSPAPQTIYFSFILLVLTYLPPLISTYLGDLKNHTGRRGPQLRVWVLSPSF